MLFPIFADGNMNILHVFQISGNFGMEHNTKYPVFLFTLSISSSSSFSSVSPASSKACFSDIVCSFFRLGLSLMKGRRFKK